MLRSVGLGLSGVTPGTYTNATITVDAHGIITLASSGAGGGGIGGSIAATQIAYGSGANTIGGDDGLVRLPGGAIGINNTSAIFSLDVNGFVGNSIGDFIIKANAGTGDIYLGDYGGGGNDVVFRISDTDQSFTFSNGTIIAGNIILGGGTIQLSTDGQAYFSNGGNIFNANGSSALANGNASIDDAGNLIATSFAVGNGNFTAANDGSVYVATAISIGGTLSTTSRLFISGNSGFPDSGITLYDGGTNDKDFAIYIADSIVHFAGAGLSSPVYQAFFEMELLVDANIISDGSTGTLTLDTNAVLGSYTGLYFRGAGLDAGLVQEGSSVFSMAINEGQIGSRDASSTGAIFRLDMRAGSTYGGQQSFIIYGSPIGGSAFNNVFAVSCETGETLLCADGGNASVGLTGSATAKLDVNGTIRARGAITNNTLTASKAVFTDGSKVLVSATVPQVVATADLTAQSAAKAATTIFTPTTTGFYRISVYLQITTAASTSSVLGGASGVVITYNDGDGNVAQTDTAGLMSTAGTIVTTSATNTTATNLNGSIVIYARTGVAIQYAIGYTSVGITAMQYAAHLKCEQVF